MKKGKPRGNITGIAIANRQTGGATSAASMAGKTGVKEMFWTVYIPGEGWVKWTEIQAQIDRAFRDWLHRKAMQGIKIFDRHSYKEAAIAQARAERSLKLAA